MTTAEPAGRTVVLVAGTTAAIPIDGEGFRVEGDTIIVRHRLSPMRLLADAWNGADPAARQIVFEDGEVLLPAGTPHTVAWRPESPPNA